MKLLHHHKPAFLNPAKRFLSRSHSCIPHARILHNSHLTSSISPGRHGFFEPFQAFDSDFDPAVRHGLRIIFIMTKLL